jgi:antitoxin component YwqK of YwqJK toxin-antitoxin module
MGKYRIWHVNGEKAVVGKYENGIKTGHWEWYSINGNLDSVITFSAGKFNGNVVRNFRDGTLKSEAIYINGLLNGEQNTYFENGELKSSFTYNNGVRTGPFTLWNSNGFKRESGTYLNDKLNGVNFRWYHHGEYSTITTYSIGQVHGIMRIYSPSGVIKKEEYYYLGQPLYQLEYFDNSGLKEIQVFKQQEVIFQKNWNNLGLETTSAKLKLGITTKTERYDSGNLLSEKSMKGNELHGLSWAFLEDRSLQYLSLYIDGKHVFRRDFMLEENEHKDYLFPDSDLQVVVKIEEKEI